jgi:hypothetical protein
MRSLRQLLTCAVIVAAALTPVDAARAQNYQVSGYLYYWDCATKIGAGTGNNDYVYVQAYASDGVTPVGSPATNCKGTYSLSIPASSLNDFPIKSVTIYYYLNNAGTGAPNCWVGSLDVIKRNQIIDIGMPQAPPGTSGTPLGTVTIRGNWYYRDGMNPLVGSDLDSDSITVNGTSYPVTPEPYTLQLTCPTTANKTLSMNYIFGAAALTTPSAPGSSTPATYTTVGVVGGGRAQTLDIAVPKIYTPAIVTTSNAFSTCPPPACEPRRCCLRGRLGIFRR